MSKKKFYIIVVFVVLVLAALIGSGQILRNGGGKKKDSGPVFEVKSGPLTISFVESGTTKARDQIIIKNEVEGRTSIITLIPEGTRVQKGDLLVELDASALVDEKVDQDIRVQNAEATYVSAKENLAVVENQAKSDVDLAKLTLQFAKQDLEKYIQGEYPYELDNAEASITLAQEKLAQAQETLQWSRQLFAEKYISQTELQKDELAEKQAALDVELAKKSLALLTDYTYKRQLAQLQSDVSQAEMALERIERKSRADVIQAQADLKAKEAEFLRQKDKLKKIEDQIVKTKIYAPADGLAIYATSAQGGFRRWSEEPLDEGQEVRERQELIYLPTGKLSKAEISIHESNLKKTQIGLPAIITVDALSEKSFYGTIQSIAPLPDSQSMWMNPDLKIYNSEIYIEGQHENLRTGMSCQAEIIIRQYEDVLFVPLQAVIRVGSEPTVYVQQGGEFVPRQVKIGLDNNKMIHIIEGLADGDVVLLNPPLKSAADTDSRENIAGELPARDIQRKIADKLNGLNADNVNKAAQPSQDGPASDMQNMKKRFENLDSQTREQLRKQYEQMTPEERQKLLPRGGRPGSGNPTGNTSSNEQ